jgi:hypothetical protein
MDTKRPDLTQIAFLFRNNGTSIQWPCYISVEKRSMFATGLNLHYPSNNEGGGQPFVFYSYMCAVHNELKLSAVF